MFPQTRAANRQSMVCSARRAPVEVGPFGHELWIKAGGMSGDFVRSVQECCYHGLLPR
jgi:hypothetical protein